LIINNRSLTGFTSLRRDVYMKIGYTHLEPPRHASRVKKAGRRLQTASTAVRLTAGRKTLSALTVSAALAVALFALSFTTSGLPGVYSGVASAAPAALETVTIYADDCKTPKTTFYLGETVCAVVEGAPLPSDGWRQRFFQWVTPNHWVTQQTDILDERQKEIFTIPTSGEFARTGKWTLRTVDSEPGTQTISAFTVHHPRIFYADLGLQKQGPVTIIPGDKIKYALSVYNQGPEYAEKIQFVVDVPTETTFVGLKQLTGPEFKCDTPMRGETGRIVCYTTALKAEETADFILYYLVNDYARDGAVSSSSAEIKSGMDEMSTENNALTFEAVVYIEGEDHGDQGEDDGQVFGSNFTFEKEYPSDPEGEARSEPEPRR
jgi:hypothetical protein